MQTYTDRAAPAIPADDNPTVRLALAAYGIHIAFRQFERVLLASLKGAGL